MYIGDGKDPSAPNDFNLQPRENICRLINWIYARKRGGSSLSALGRVAAWFEAHAELPCTADKVRWENLAGLRAAMAHFGPNCSEADLNAAISALPSPAAFSSEANNTWDITSGSWNEGYDYTDTTVPGNGPP